MPGTDESLEGFGVVLGFELIHENLLVWKQKKGLHTGVPGDAQNSDAGVRSRCSAHVFLLNKGFGMMRSCDGIRADTPGCHPI